MTDSELLRAANLVCSYVYLGQQDERPIRLCSHEDGVIAVDKSGLIVSREVLVSKLKQALQFYDIATPEIIEDQNMFLAKRAIFAMLPSDEEASDSQSGLVYLARSDCGLHKIGFSKNPSVRMKQLSSCATHPVNLVCSFQQSRPAVTESVLHKRYDSVRVRGEWFNLSEWHVKEIKAIARHFNFHDGMDDSGCNVVEKPWTCLVAQEV